MPGEETLVTRLGEIPVLNDSWTTAWGYYAKIKDYNSLTKLTLATAEHSMITAAWMSGPVVTRYQPQIDSLNGYACTKLDELENKYPVIKLPSDQVKDACMVYVGPVMGHVKPVVAQVQGIVDESKRRVNSIKAQGTHLVEGARDLGVGTVTGAVNMTLASPPGRLATRTADGALTIADGLLDKYIPEMPVAEHPIDDDGDSSSISTTSTTSVSSVESLQDNNDIQEMDVMEPTPERVVIHFKTVSRKLRRRLFQKAMRDFQGAKVRTQESLGNFHGVVDLIDYAKNNFGSAKGKIEELWQKITEEERPERVNTGPETIEERIVSLGRILTQRIRTGIHTLERIAHSAGQVARDPITKSKEFRELARQFTSDHDLSNISMESVRTNLVYLQTKVQVLVENVQSPEWPLVSNSVSPLDHGDLSQAAIHKGNANKHG